MITQGRPGFTPASAPRESGAPDRPLVVAPLALEALIVRSARSGLPVLHSGMGPRRSSRAVPRITALDPRPLVVIGFAGALTDASAPGSLVLADRIVPPRGPAIACPACEPIARLLRGAGLAITIAPIASNPRIIGGSERARLAARGALAVDMEAAWLARAAPDRLAVLRVIVDTPGRDLRRPLATIAGGMRAAMALRAAARALADLRPDPGRR